MSISASAMGTMYYVDPRTGSDSHTGSLSDPWRTVSSSIPKLQAGDTLFLREGIYLEDNININVRGTDFHHIAIKNYENESPVIDGGYKEFRSVPNSDWELFEAARNIYRSVKTYANAGLVHGYLDPGGNMSHLVPYENYEHLSSHNENYTETGSVYVGPGVFWNSSDQRIYIRLQPSRQGRIMGYTIPSNVNPGQHEICIVPDGAGLHFKSNAAYIDIEGIDIRYRDNALLFETGSHHISVRNAHILGGRSHIKVTNNVHHLIFDSVTINDSFPPWVAWSDVKRGTKPAHSLQQVAIGLKNGVHDVEIRNSLFKNIFDGIGAASKVYNVYIQNNEFHGIRDDVIQLGTASYNVDIGFNKMIHVSKGPGRNGSGHSVHPGTKYIHHNIIDLKEKYLYFRAGDPHYTESGDGMSWHVAFGSHSDDKGYIDPWKIYNNTIIAGEMRNANYHDKGVGYAYKGVFNGVPQEVYNNIFIQTRDYIMETGIDVSDGAHILDGNLYYKKVPGSNPLFRDWDDGTRESDFHTLSQFRSDNFFAVTQSHYPPGWENSGVEADPQLDNQYRPLAGSPAGSGAIDLSSNGWPGTHDGGFRGAQPYVVDKQ
ncbi:MAG: hypothetical protein JSW20_06790 [Nitrospiraceae bacterium]|nr:MAG: hypothetical protein JSW20_06790 [Nitrospiraceae bacterium]